MTTQTSTVTRTRYVRSWRDFDPKFLAAAAVAIGTIVISGVLVAARAMTVQEALTASTPVLLGAAVAYVKTSTHRAVIEDGVDTAARVLEEAEPVVAAIAPAAVPAMEVAQDAVGQIQAALTEAPPTPLTGLPTA